MSDTTMPDYPRIFLQPNEAGIGNHTWCQDRINETDIEYVRSDIAAAPELLVALKAAHKLLDRIYETDGLLTEERATLARIEAAMAKAEGQP
jgi:hypothetical protein